MLLRNCDCVQCDRGASRQVQQTTSSVLGASDLPNLCETLMSKLDLISFHFWMKLSQQLRTTTTVSVIFSGGCLPGNSSHDSGLNVHYFEPKALPLANA